MDEFKNKFEFQSTLPRGERRRVSAGKSARNYFNPRSREGSDRIPRRKDKRRLHFNPRSREGSDLFTIRRILITSFQSTLPRGERRELLTNDKLSEAISIHAPARGATLRRLHPEKRHLFQSTLPRGERLRAMCSLRIYRNISIHAPARGATLRRLHPEKRHLFQSTLPRGERRANGIEEYIGTAISIHAPARGATLKPQLID